MISRWIPLFAEDDSVESEGFGRFLYKASTGSCKAPEILDRAVLSLGEAVGGRTLVDTAQLDEFWAAISPRVQEAAPANAQELLDDCAEGQLLRARMVARAQPFLKATAYADLWRRKRRVDEFRLLHDSALHAASAWSAESLREIDEQDLMNYNSRDMVAGMLMLLRTIGGTSSTAGH